MNIQFAIKRLKQEKLSFKFILSRIILRLNVKLPLTVKIDRETESRIYLHPSPFPHKLFIKKNYFKSDNEIIKRFVREGDVVFDVGADLGALSVMFSSLCGNSGKVFAFEPTKRTFRFLMDNIKLNKADNVFAVNAAVSEKDGEAAFIEHRYSHGLNYIDRMGAGTTNRVYTIRLDSFLKNHNLSKIDFLKIDVEGSELFILESLGERLKNVKTIYFEFHPKNYQRAGYRPQDILNFLEKNNFEIFIPVQKEKEFKLVLFKKQPIYTEKLNLLAFNKNESKRTEEKN